MEQNINEKLEELFNALDNSSLIKNLNYYKKMVLNDNCLVAKINEINSLNIYDPKYKEIKLELYKNDNYRNYINCEQELNFIIMNINSKFKKIIGDKHEDN